MAGLLQTLVRVSEKAAHIARLCRQEDALFHLLVAEKTGADRNERFVQDFKTLADVLIQEVIKHDVGKEFPELQDHIRGEESNEFGNGLGETVVVRVCATRDDTAALLCRVLDRNRAAAELLAAAVHRDVALGDAELDAVALSIPAGELAIWIDPIDSTNEYVRGREDVAPVEGIHPGGLRSALVLIGAYDRRTGCPVLGVINEPFFRRDPLTRRWHGRYHWGVSYRGARLCSLSPPPPRPEPAVVLSRAEPAAVRAALAPLCGPRLRVAAGAGYKMLCVILGLADAYMRRQIASEKEEIDRLRAEIAEIQSRQQHGRSETEEYSSESESESEDEEELQVILEDLQRQNEELEIKNNHLNQAIHEEREAIIELRVQLRLLQRAKSEQQVQEEEEPEKRGGVSQQQRDSVLETKAAKEQPKASKEQQVKPSPSKDRKETPI